MVTKLRTLMLIGLLLPLSVRSQMHDFDSLYDNNAFFRMGIEMVKDTISLFSSESPLEFFVEGNLKALVKNKMGENDYQNMDVRHQLNDTIMVNKVIRAKARGNFRRMRCKYPPIRLNFKDTEFKIDQFKELDKMKMVVRCQDQGQYEQFILLEYLVYKMLNILTDYSFKARLIKINIKDTGGKFKGGVTYAFVIETYDEFEDRLNGEIIDRENLHPNLCNYDHTNLTAVFQYMIGNTDWSIVVGHNIKVFQLADELKPYAIPYDFDHAGLVDAPYAAPNEILPITDVRDRLFRGFCRSEEEFQKAFDVFKERKDQIYELIQSFDLLDKRYKEKLISYIDEFYEDIENPRVVKAEFAQNCIK